jgi:hypothetical protein
VSMEHVEQNPEVWEKVLRKLRGRYMPPPGLPRPDEPAYETQVSLLERALDDAATGKLNPGRTDTVRRLTRTEYHNAIRDLLGVEVDVTPLLPADEASYGFDNVTVGNLSPTLLDRYLSAAEKISRLAVGIPGRSPGGDTFIVPPDLTQEDHFDKLPPGTRGGAVISYTFPVDGKYDIRLRLARDSREHIAGLVGPQDVELLLDKERV